MHAPAHVCIVDGDRERLAIRLWSVRQIAGTDRFNPR